MSIIPTKPVHYLLYAEANLATTRNCIKQAKVALDCGFDTTATDALLDAIEILNASTLEILSALRLMHVTPVPVPEGEA